ncbi:ubiquitin carboxyl-terminal hydrolase 37-like isoform X2 [Dendronephthya gigantea]|uniref:ubiquitin carboxyl-terminal hydrolase 37-like isoform X2 n=1 Tax=Dendronephthya gigantea TaxID=151771 RepID=UPI00106A8FE9|nr:ubiquitin carboxyl-terminal hydrolase 37-like isoform X2 [Dendronephthya gigantea]
MATGNLYKLMCEVKGQVNWRSAKTASIPNRTLPGVLCLSSLGDNFYIQCKYKQGKTSRKYKLDVGQLVETKLIARERKLAISIPEDTGTCFNLQEADENEINEFISSLDKIKERVLSKALSKNTQLFEHIGPVTRVSTLSGSKEAPQRLSEQLDKSSISQNNFQEKRKLVSPNPNTEPQDENQMAHPETKTLRQIRRERILKELSEKGVSIEEEKERIRAQLNKLASSGTKNTSPRDIPKIMPHPNNQHRQKSPERTKGKRTEKVATDDLEKENINIFGSTLERKITPVKQVTFSSPRRQSPLKENETSPQLRPVNASSFYGSNNKTLRVKRSARKPAVKRSLDIRFSSPPIRESPFFTTPLASSETRSANKPSKDSRSTFRKQAKLSSSYFKDSVITSQGFSNLGNTCYMNAILQSILGLVPFVQDLKNNDILKTVNRTSFYSCLTNLFQCKNKDGASTAKETALKRLKNSINCERFSGYEQNDAHEFMYIFLDQMKEEVQQALEDNSEETIAKVCPVVRNFEGSLKHVIECKGCKNVVTKHEIFNHLSLYLPRSHTSSLTRLLGRFFQVEELERTCEKCDCETATQYVKIQTLPRVIILHILRSGFDQYRGTQEKISNQIQVDRFLVVGSFCCSDVSGPQPFFRRRKSPSKSDFVADCDLTPFSDEDFAVTKPRRRLNMSAADDTLSDTTPEKTAFCTQENSSSSLKKNAFSSQKNAKKKYPDWVYAQTKRPTVINCIDSSDDDDLNKAKLASLNLLSEEEQIRRAKIESLKEETELQNFEITVSVEPVSDSSASEFPGVKTLQENKSLESEEEEIRLAKVTSLDECFPNVEERIATEGNEIRGGSNTKRRNLSSEEETKTHLEELERVNTTDKTQASHGSSSKRRKIEQTGNKTMDMDIVPADYDENKHLKEALEMSLRDKDLEQSQMEEAIRMSLQDGLDNVKLNDIVLPETSGDDTDMKEMGEENASTDDFSYRLVSVVSHVGSSASVGHYISDVYDIESEQWTRYDDITAEKIEEYAVRYCKRSDGYIYFYMHRSCVNLLQQKSTIS